MSRTFRRKNTEIHRSKTRRTWESLAELGFTYYRYWSSSFVDPTNKKTIARFHSDNDKMAWWTIGRGGPPAPASFVAIYVRRDRHKINQALRESVATGDMDAVLPDMRHRHSARRDYW